MAGKGGRTESTPFFGSIGGIEPAGKGCGNIRAGDRREGRPQAAVPRHTGAEGEGREAFEGRAHSAAQAQTKKRKRKSRAA